MMPLTTVARQARRLHTKYGTSLAATNFRGQAFEAGPFDATRTGSGCVERPGFERLAAEVCSGEGGAIFCVEASRLARNGREWHHLIDLCGMVGAVVVDLDGIYDPTLTNDRLLLV